MNNKIKAIAETFINKFPLKKIIVFESYPDFSDNTRAVFNELVKRGVNKNYTLVWATHDNNDLNEDLKALDNVIAAQMDSFKYKYYYSYFAKAIIVSNFFLQKRREEQYYLYLAHGAAIKKIRNNRYYLPDYAYGCDYICYSELFSSLDLISLRTDKSMVNTIPAGYARNDDLFKKINLNECFKDYNFDKTVYWLPTFRQKDGVSYSSISIPFIHDNDDLLRINNKAKDCRVLLIVKPHPFQDMSNINISNLSNIVFIDNSFLMKNSITNYTLMGNCDALLSDYSSVYYDFLLCDKPIGLCWEDIDEYEANEGILNEVKPYLDGGVKLHKTDELIEFIDDVSNDNDALCEIRNDIKAKVHKYADNHSSERITNIILSNIGFYETNI